MGWFKKKEVVDNRQKIVFINDFNKSEIVRTLYTEGSRPFIFQFHGILPCISSTIYMLEKTWKVNDIWMYMDALPGPENILMKIYIREVV